MSKLKLNQLNDFVDPNQENDIQQNTVNNPDEQPDIDDTVNENVNPEDIENQNDNENDTSEKDFIKYKELIKLSPLEADFVSSILKLSQTTSVI